MDDEDVKNEIRVSARFTITFDFEKQVIEAEIEKKFGAKPKARNHTVKV